MTTTLPGSSLSGHQVTPAFDRAAHRYDRMVVIPLAGLTSGDTRVYRYLWRSVRRFDSPQELTDRLAAAYVDVAVRTVP